MILFIFEGDEREPRLYETITRENTMPTEKHVVNQLSIFERQLLLHVKPNRNVAVLNSFPLFIYEYMK